MVYLLKRTIHTTWISKDQSEEIVREIREIKDVEEVLITPDHEYLKIETEDERFADVMGRAINICSRVADGVEISFAKFASV